MSNVKHHEGSGDRRSIDSTIRGSWRHRAPSRTDVAGRTFVRPAVDGGLKPHSDIDLLVTVTVRLDETTRRALINDLWKLRLPRESEILRAVEVTIVVHDDIIPWRYPAKRELQFGEWQRNDILAGIFEPATIDIDLAILLTKAREHSVALVGPAAEELLIRFLNRIYLRR